MMSLERDILTNQQPDGSVEKLNSTLPMLMVGRAASLSDSFKNDEYPEYRPRCDGQICRSSKEWLARLTAAYETR